MSKNRKKDLSNGHKFVDCTDLRTTCTNHSIDCHKIANQREDHRLAEKREDGKLRRRKEVLDHKFELTWKSTLLALFVILTIASLITLLDATAPPKAQEFASTFLKTAFGTGVGYLVGKNAKTSSTSRNE
jgi:hypothetical protein